MWMLEERAVPASVISSSFCQHNFKESVMALKVLMICIAVSTLLTSCAKKSNEVVVYTSVDQVFSEPFLKAWSSNYKDTAFGNGDSSASVQGHEGAKVEKKATIQLSFSHRTTRNDTEQNMCVLRNFKNRSVSRVSV
jgi:hypothetical protein